MRILCGIFFLSGFIWAGLVSWICLVFPIALFASHHPVRLFDVVVSLAFSCFASQGFLVWLGWGGLAFHGKIPFLKPIWFWVLSLVNHAGWLVWFPVARQESLEQFSTSAVGIYVWLMVNLTVAMCAILICFANGISVSFPDFDPPAAEA